MPARVFDALMIGSGQANNPLAHNLADKGWKVALIEREHLGGSCINYGCTPTKTMIASAQVAHYVRRAPDFGIHPNGLRVDMGKVVELKNKNVLDWRQGQERHVAQRPNISLIRGEASFSGPHTVRVDGQELTAEHIFINTGTSPAVLPIEGIESVPSYTNLDIMDLAAVPQHLLVIGGSYVGLEFGQLFLRLGSRVSVVEFSEDIVAREDPEVSASLREALEAEGMRFHLASRATRVARAANGDLELSVEPRQGGERQVLSGSNLLMAAGRQANTRALNLEAAGIQHERGYITVNEYLETSVPGVYALGDVNGGPAFTHIAYDDFQIVFHNLFHAQKRSTRGRIVPYTLYTDPELGRVGLTEREARQQGRAIKIGSIPMAWVARAIERQETRGLMKIVVDAETERLLGAAVLASGGGELAQALMVLMLADAPWTVLRKAVYVHPTLSEGFFSLMESVQ